MWAMIFQSNAYPGFDGWSSPSNAPIIGIAVQGRKGVHLLSAIDTSGEPHTSIYVSELIKEGVASAQELLGVEVVAVVTDGASNMEVQGQWMVPPPLFPYLFL